MVDMTTTNDVKQALADKLLSGEVLSMHDRENIAAMLECESAMETAYRIMCRKLWLQTKPSDLKLTQSEEDFLNKLFPRRGKGRDEGASEAFVLMALYYQSIRPTYKSDRKAHAEIVEAYKSIEPGLNTGTLQSV